MSEVVFLDLETTGLDPDRHVIWEIGLIDERGEDRWFVRSDMLLAEADPNALRITDFYNRHPYYQGDDSSLDVVSALTAANHIARRTAGKHIVGAVPSFDAAFCDKLLRVHHLAPAWHYHLIDVEALVAGRFGVRPPWDTDELSRLAGVDPAGFVKHEALEDARWAKAMYESVMVPR